MDLLWNVLHLTFILCVLQLLRVNCQNENRKSSVDDIIIDFVNDTYIDEDSCELSINYKDDGNSMTVKLDIIKELPPQLFLRMKVWGRALGQYKLPTGISMDFDICTGRFNTVHHFLDTVLRNIGVSECPPKPGSYGVEDYPATINVLPVVYGLPGVDFLIESEIYSPPDISLLKIKIFCRVF